MNFHHSTYTTHRPRHTSSHFNEDARCDNEVNLILEKNYNQQLTEQSIYTEQQPSVVVKQTNQYYFMPIREQSSTMAVPSNNNSNVPDATSILLTDHDKPSKQNLFDYSTSTSNMNSSELATVNKTNNNYNLTDADLAAIFVSSIGSITPSSTTIDNRNELSDNSNTLDDMFLQQVNDLVCSSQEKSVGPPPGFESFRFDTSSSSDNSTTIPSISTAAIQPHVSCSDTINFSQLLQSTFVDSQQQQPIGGNVHSSSSSHSSFASDEQSIFFPMSTHHYSSSSQISFTNTPPSSTTTTTNSIAKPNIPNGLSSNAKTFSLIDTSPKQTKLIDTDTIIKDDDITTSHLFASPNSFFSNAPTGFVQTKSSTTKSSSTNRQSSSSTSSSTSSSIDEALIQLSQQQSQAQTVNKLFSDESLSIFHFPSSKPTTNIDKQQRAVHDNINFLASMAAASTPVTPESPWQQTLLHSNMNLQPKIQSTMRQQQTILPQSPSRNASTTMQELMENLNELCYRGFDELNALIQEQRWVQNYLNINSSSLPSPSSPLANTNGLNCGSSRILIVPEYFIFKCKKVEITGSHIYELLATGRPELRLRDLMFVFKSWKESIANAEFVQQEDEMKLRLNTEHYSSYYTNETVVKAVFDRVFNAIRQLSNMTQQARAAFQYATLNVFQMSSRQPQGQTTSNMSQSSNAIALAQLQAMQQQKSSSVHRMGGSIRTTP